MVAIGSLSVAANALRDLLKEGDGGISGLQIDQIKIGHPKDTFEIKNNSQDKNHLNLFFYNVKYDGYPADGSSEDPFYVRLYCLISPLGSATGNPSPGEKDLRLIGEVMRVLHEHPVVSIKDENGHDVAQLEIVPQPMDLEHLNHVWSTQGDTAYRLSVAYEMALAPVPLSIAVERSPLVGEAGSVVQGNMDVPLLPDGGFGIETSGPVVPKFTVNASQPGWSPHICFVDEAGVLNYTLLLPVSQLPASGLLSLKALIAGKISTAVNLVWETWSSSGVGWERNDPLPSEIIATDSIDPNHVDLGLAVDVELPLQDKGQATLYAERAWQRPDGSTVTLRSNPLLVTVIEASA